MQGMLVILVLSGSIGFNPPDKIWTSYGLSYNAWSRGSKLPTAVKIEPLWLGNVGTDYNLSLQKQNKLDPRLPVPTWNGLGKSGRNYLMGNENSSLQSDFEVPSDSIKKPTAIDYVIEGIGGTIGGVSGFLFVAIPLFILTAPEEGEEYGLGGPLIPVGIPSYCIGLPVGSTTGVIITGKIIGQDGSFWKALISSYIGTLIGTVIGASTSVLYLNNLIEESGATIGWSCMVVSPIVGAVIGYNK